VLTSRRGLAASAGILVLVVLGVLALGHHGGARRPAGPREVVVPAKYRSYFVVAARRCPGVLSPAGLAAQAKVESNFRPAAVSRAGAEGLMQVTPAVWARYGVDADGDGRADPFTAADSVATSARYSCVLSRLVRPVPGDRTALRLAAYNAGPAAVTRYRGVPPYPETRNYVLSVRRWTLHFAPQLTPVRPAAAPSRPS
jgi:soluble lytic murein transglycosylase-like protein